MNREYVANQRQFKRISTSTISDVLDGFGIEGMLTGFHSITPGVKMVGRAVTVTESSLGLGKHSLEEFRIGEVIDTAERGDIIVFNNEGRDVSTWGYLASLEATIKGIGGVVVHGGVRDVDDIRRLRFPVFAEHVVPTSGKGRIKIESINTPIEMKGVRVSPGDTIVADGTGIAVVPHDQIGRVLEEANRLEELEHLFVSRVRKGASLSELSAKHRHL